MGTIVADERLAGLPEGVEFVPKGKMPPAPLRIRLKTSTLLRRAVPTRLVGRARRTQGAPPVAHPPADARARARRRACDRRRDRPRGRARGARASGTSSSGEAWEALFWQPWRRAEGRRASRCGGCARRNPHDRGLILSGAHLGPFFGGQLRPRRGRRPALRRDGQLVLRRAEPRPLGPAHGAVADRAARAARGASRAAATRCSPELLRRGLTATVYFDLPGRPRDAVPGQARDARRRHRPAGLRDRRARAAAAHSPRRRREPHRVLRGARPARLLRAGRAARRARRRARAPDPRGTRPRCRTRRSRGGTTARARSAGAARRAGRARRERHAERGAASLRAAPAAGPVLQRGQPRQPTSSARASSRRRCARVWRRGPGRSEASVLRGAGADGALGPARWRRGRSRCWRRAASTCARCAGTSCSRCARDARCAAELRALRSGRAARAQPVDRAVRARRSCGALPVVLSVDATVRDWSTMPAWRRRARRGARRSARASALERRALRGAALVMAWTRLGAARRARRRGTARERDRAPPGPGPRDAGRRRSASRASARACCSSAGASRRRAASTCSQALRRAARARARPRRRHARRRCRRSRA